GYPLRANPGLDAHLLHQPGYAGPAKLLPVGQQGRVNTRAAVGLSGGFPNLANLFLKMLIFQCTLRWRATNPPIVSTPGYPQYFGHFRKGKYVFILIHKLEYYGFGPAKMPMAFFRISRCILTFVSSRCSLAIFSSSGVCFSTPLPGKLRWGSVLNSARQR